LGYYHDKKENKQLSYFAICLNYCIHKFFYHNHFPASFTICPCKSPFRVAGQLALADKVVNAVKSGAIRKFVVMAGCDGRMKKRNYYTEFAEQLPDDCVILTAGFAKYRYNKLSLGDINGIPRVLDTGQCNDSYSLALTAMKLQDVFGLEGM